MDETIHRALGHSQTIDITTTGRKTGLPRRIEIVFFNFDDRIYISGLPRPGRRRSWLANLEAQPAFTFHLKGRVAADLPATAREVTDPTERRAILEKIARAWRRTDVDTMVAASPLIEVTLPGLAA
jgi:deazaflavin-dependent oxidoreductase (nitroreductase family)